MKKGANFVPHGTDSPDSGQKYGRLEGIGEAGATDEVLVARGKNGDMAAFASDASSSVDAVIAGVNWYLNRHAKIIVDYVRSNFSGQIDGDDCEQGVMTRFQLVF